MSTLFSAKPRSFDLAGMGDQVQGNLVRVNVIRNCEYFDGKEL